MDWNGCLSTMQGYLENSPLIVLGSGASMPYGLPSMSSLAECIKSSDIVKNDPNYGAFCASLSSGQGIYNCGGIFVCWLWF